jgi:hypothetical protein
MRVIAMRKSAAKIRLVPMSSAAAVIGERFPAIAIRSCEEKIRLARTNSADKPKTTLSR